MNREYDLLYTAHKMRRMEEYMTHSRSETVELGRKLAARLTPGALIAFTGGLGAGKTAMCQGIAVLDGEHRPPDFQIGPQQGVGVSGA